MSTTILPTSQTITFDGSRKAKCPDELLKKYTTILEQQRLSRTEHLRLDRMLGSGGQGVVYLSQRRGSDNFTLPVALKIFSPERYPGSRGYEDDMARIAQVAGKVAQIQQDNLLDVQNFIERDRIRMMEMEWIDGYDLNRLLTPGMLERVRHRVSQRRWEYINNVIVTGGPVQPRLKPGIAVSIAS
jgi:serine/threonine protein kinase